MGYDSDDLTIGGIFVLLISLAIWGTVAYVFIHFAIKYW